MLFGKVVVVAYVPPKELQVGVPVASRPDQHLVLSVVSASAILVGMWSHLMILTVLSSF